LGWQWVFPASSLCQDVYTGLPTRHHQHEKILQREQSRPPCTKRGFATGYSVIRRLWLYYAGSPDIFSFNFSEVLWPTPNLQIRTSSIPLVWCWASSSFSRSSCSVSRVPSARILKRKRGWGTPCPSKTCTKTSRHSRMSPSRVRTIRLWRL